VSMVLFKEKGPDFFFTPTDDNTAAHM